MEGWRFAIVEGERFFSTVQQYLPSNYEAIQAGPCIFIYGKDDHGWTLDGYVIPRLSSGLIFAREIK